MELSFPWLVPACLLLWVPICLKAGKPAGYRKSTQSRQQELKLLLRSKSGWGSLLQGAAGTYLLMHLALHAPEVWNLRKIVLVSSVLGLGVLLQVFHSCSLSSLSYPLLYLTGITLVMPGYVEGAFAAIMGWAIAVGNKDLRWQPASMAVALAIVAYWNKSLGLLVFANLALILFPFACFLILNQKVTFVGDSPKRKKPSAPNPTSQPESLTLAAEKNNPQI